MVNAMIFIKFYFFTGYYFSIEKVSQRTGQKIKNKNKILAYLSQRQKMEIMSENHEKLHLLRTLVSLRKIVQFKFTTFQSGNYHNSRPYE